MMLRRAFDGAKVTETPLRDVFQVKNESRVNEFQAFTTQADT
jgi:hypothetical protein